MVTQPGNAVEVLAARQGGSAALQAFCYTGWELEAGSWKMGGNIYEWAYHLAGAIRYHRYAPDPARPLRRHGGSSCAWRGQDGPITGERHTACRDCPAWAGSTRRHAPLRGPVNRQ